MLTHRLLALAILLGSPVACDSKDTRSEAANSGEAKSDAKAKDGKTDAPKKADEGKEGGKAAADGGATATAKAEIEVPTKAEPAAGDPKVLLSLEDAQDILGLTLEMDTRGEGYSYTSKSPTGSITVDLVSAVPLRILKGNKETIPDIGDGAFFQAKSPRMVILHVMKGEAGLTISVGFPMGAPPKAKDLAKAALEVARRAVPNM